jgi:predicted enzyme related to lactoylglutathione lyase
VTEPRLYRVILQVDGLQEAARFYETLLGTTGRDIRGGGRYYIDCGPVILALVGPTAAGEGGPKPNADNIYFSVDDLEDVHARARKLGCLSNEDVHGEPAGETVRRPWGERSFYAVDPWGNRVCFVDAATVFTGR